MGIKQWYEEYSIRISKVENEKFFESCDSNSDE